METANRTIKFYVDYNAKFIAMYMRLQSCIKFINRKGLKNDCDNMLRIFDNTGVEYDPITGNEVID